MSCGHSEIDRATSERSDQPSERSSDRASKRLSGRASKRSSDRAIERSSERPTERASARAKERSSDRASDQVIERAIERTIERAIEQAIERSCDRPLPQTKKNTSAPDVRLRRRLVHLARSFKTQVSKSIPEALFHPTLFLTFQKIGTKLRHKHSRAVFFFNLEFRGFE